jgi:polyisoprenyl-phosphate glycosyltransferase
MGDFARLNSPGISARRPALTAGLDAARGDVVIPLDADLQDPPDLIPALIAAWQQGADVVVARRRCRDSDTYLKRNTARLFYRLHNKLAEVQMPADVGDFRLMDRSVVEASNGCLNGSVL